MFFLLLWHELSQVDIVYLNSKQIIWNNGGLRRANCWKEWRDKTLPNKLLSVFNNTWVLSVELVGECLCALFTQFCTLQTRQFCTFHCSSILHFADVDFAHSTPQFLPVSNTLLNKPSTPLKVGQSNASEQNITSFYKPQTLNWVKTAPIGFV